MTRKTFQIFIIFTVVLSLFLATTGIASAGANWDDPCNRGGQCFSAPAVPSCNAGFTDFPPGVSCRETPGRGPNK